MSPRVWIGAFALCLVAPWVDLSLRPDAVRDPERYENRRAAQRPSWSWSPALLAQYPARFERYFADHLGGRDWLLRAHSIQCLEIFGVHPAPNLYLGRDGWWFYSEDRALELLRTQAPLPPEELAAWVDSLSRIARWCEQHSVPFAVAFGPNKETIYPEYLPEKYAGKHSVRLDQLMPALAAQNVRCIDLRPALREAKAADAPGDWLYHRLGTHWTDRGGLIAAQALLRALESDLPGLLPLEESQFRQQAAESEEDSLAGQSYVADRYLQRPISRIPQEGYRAQQSSLASLPYPIAQRRDPARGERPTMLLVHDSFGAPIDKYLAEALGSLVQTHRYAIDRDLVLSTRPDVLVALYVERHLGGAPFTLAGGYTADESEGRFARSKQVLLRWEGGTADFQTQRGTRLESSDRGLLVRTQSPADTLLLPIMPYPSEGGAALRLELDAEHAQVLDLFYLRPGYTQHDRSANIELELVAGFNRLTVVLDQPGLHGRLCLRPRTPGTLTLRSLELRAPPPP